MNEEHNKLMAYVLDEPEEAALELARLREANNSSMGWFIVGLLGGLFMGLLFF